MTLFYFDTSGILKRYKSEKGSEVVDELFEQRKPGETFASSLLTALEVISVVSRMLRGRTLSRREYDSLTSRFLADFTSQFQIGAVDNSLIVESMRIVMDRQLKTADAIHLAAIQRMRTVAAGSQQVVVVTSDREMIATSEAEGIEVLNPEEDASLDRLRGLR